MTRKSKRFAASMMPLLLGLGVAGIAAGAGQAGSAGSAGSTAEPVRCEIRASTAQGMVTLEGVVHADRSVSGSYGFRVKSAGSAGSSDIGQSGDFTAAPGSPATLGRVMLASQGARYDASLKVTWNGKSLECAERIAAR